jgi:hypothetical protein
VNHAGLLPVDRFELAWIAKDHLRSGAHPRAAEGAGDYSSLRLGSYAEVVHVFLQIPEGDDQAVGLLKIGGEFGQVDAGLFEQFGHRSRVRQGFV